MTTSVEAVPLCVNLAPDVAAVLKTVADEQGVSATEAIRRAISLLWFFHQVRSRGAVVLTAENAGKGQVKEIVFGGTWM